MENKMKTNLLTIMAVSLISATAMAAKPVVYPAAPEQPRVQFLKSINGGSFFISGNGYGNRFPGYEMPAQKETDAVGKPYGIATTAGKIYICDMASATVKVFDLDKKYITSIGADKIGKLEQPLNIAIDADGTKYVADGKLGKIMVYDANNLFVKSIGNSAKMKASDVVIVKGNLYVTDVMNSQIVVINPKTGAELSRFSQAGMEAGDLFKATNLTTDMNGNIVVADTIGGKVSVFADNGKFVKNFGKLGDGLGQFARPKGVAVDHANNLYAIDAAFENIQIFNEQGQLLLPFGTVGNTAGGLNMPVKVAIDYTNVKYFKDAVIPGYAVDYLIFVTNQFGDNKVNVYGFLKKL
jgi:DNA-binding beta-propeller fold protein YncE